MRDHLLELLENEIHHIQMLFDQLYNVDMNSAPHKRIKNLIMKLKILNKSIIFIIKQMFNVIAEILNKLKTIFIEKNFVAKKKCKKNHINNMQDYVQFKK